MRLSPRALRRSVLAVAFVTAVAAPAAHAGSFAKVVRHRVETEASQPRHLTPASDGNVWVTLNGDFNFEHSIARVTPRGDITEFPVCSFCYPNDIVEGPDGVLYFSTNEPRLGRIATSGQVLGDVAMPATNVIADGLAADSTSVWFADHNNNRIGRYEVFTGALTFFSIPTAGANVSDVAVTADGAVWFTEFHADKIGRLDPATGVVTEIPVSGGPQRIDAGADGSLWFTEPFARTVGRIVPGADGAHRVTELPAPGTNPMDVVVGDDGNAWFTQYGTGNVVRMSPAGDSVATKPAAGAGPFGITIAANGNPWFTELEANNIATLRLR